MSWGEDFYETSSSESLFDFRDLEPSRSSFARPEFIKAGGRLVRINDAFITAREAPAPALRSLEQELSLNFAQNLSPRPRAVLALDEEEVVGKRRRQSSPEVGWFTRLVRFVRRHMPGAHGYNRDWERELRELREFAAEKERHENANWRPHSLKEITSLTKFNEKEIKVIYRAFKQSSPTGVVHRGEFIQLFSSMFPYGDSDTFAAYLFSIFDIDGNNAINFNEFVQGLSVTSRGTPEEKVRWIFTLYDVNKTGVITFDELLAIIRSVCQIVGPNGRPALTEDLLRRHTKEVFEKLDLDSDGVISEEEFLKACLNDPVIMKSISVFETVF